jgi:DNA replication protein DnaC
MKTQSMSAVVNNLKDRIPQLNRTKNSRFKESMWDKGYLTKDDIDEILKEEAMVKAYKLHKNDRDLRLDLGGFPISKKERDFYINHNFYKTDKWSFDAIDKEKWVYVSGKPGTGKTSLACHLAWYYLRKEVIREASFVSVSEWMNNLLSSFQKNGKVPVDAIPKLKKFVVLDDFDKFRKTDWQQTQIFNLVDYLYRSEKIVIITSNRSLDEIVDYHKDGDENNINIETAMDRIKGRSAIAKYSGSSMRGK